MAATVTNTLHVAVPSGVDPVATCAVFARFGEVQDVRALPDDAEKVAVSFFDVRAAASAVEALGSTYKHCAHGPQDGSRTVQLAGAVPVQAEYLSAISGIFYKGAWDGNYVVEFFDVRDAARFQKDVGDEAQVLTDSEAVSRLVPLPPWLRHPSGAPCPGPSPGEEEAADEEAEAAAPARSITPPPGLTAPPGLPCGSAAAPKRSAAAAAAGQGLGTMSGPGPGPAWGGVEDVAEAPFQVHVSGLHNRLLNNAMMEAMLDQAGVEAAVLGFTTTVGHVCGEARVNFWDYGSAARFVTHVQGCRWGQDSRVVAQIINLQAKAASAPRPSAPPRERRSKHAAVAKKVEVRAMLEKDSPAYIRFGTRLSPAAPEFVPPWAAAAEAVSATSSTGGLSSVASVWSKAASDVSTELGESEAELDAEAPSKVSASASRAGGEGSKLGC